MEMSNVDRTDRLMDKVREGFAEKEFDYAGPIQVSKIMKMAYRWFLDMNEYKARRSLHDSTRHGCICYTRQRAREIYKEMSRIDEECWKLRGAHRYDSMRKFLLELREEKIIDFKTTKAKKWNR